uniref:Reverse transcriptase domain-containing protein n=1 Tax=Tanacetum cinerariifolium TaxID=118510 RepID=A0A6L2LTM8_TANCI|nr:hypothetical protein [Tanacetum cinerariifolium]
MDNQIRPPGFAQPNVQNNQNRFGPPQGFNHGNNFNPEHSYQAPTQQNQNVHLNELEKVRRMNEANMKAMQTQIDMVKNELRNEMKRSGPLPSNTVANPKGELKAITTRSGLVIDGPTVPTPPQSINPKVDERVEEAFTDPDLTEYTIKQLHINITLADALIVMPKYQKMLKALLSNKEKLQELANIPLNENCSASPPYLRKTFLTDARALIDVHGEEMILRDDLDSTKYPHLPLHDNPLSGSTTYFSNPLLEEFADELPLEYDDNLQFDIESDPKEIEFLLYQDTDSSLKDSIDQKNLANLADNFVDSIPEMFTDEHALDYSPPSIFDEYDDDF